jgi:hypothetical protein
VTDNSTAVSPRNAQAGFGNDVLAAIDGFESALAALDTAGFSYESISDYGTGFRVIEKDKVIGVPFIVMEWRFNEGDFGEFCSAAIVTKNGDKFVINDGSTGIRLQLQMVTAARIAQGKVNPQAGLMVPNGLTVSSYETEIDGKMTKARTFYLSESPASA